MARMGELLPARSLIIEHLHTLEPAMAVDAHLLLTNIALLLGTPAPAKTALGALNAMKAQGHFRRIQARHLGCLPLRARLLPTR